MNIYRNYITGNLYIDIVQILGGILGQLPGLYDPGVRAFPYPGSRAG